MQLELVVETFQMYNSTYKLCTPHWVGKYNLKWIIMIINRLGVDSSQKRVNKFHVSNFKVCVG